MAIIETEELGKRYGRLQAIRQLTVRIPENRIIGLIGRNGAGKTTLLRMIAGYARPSSGRLNVFSQPPYDNLKVSANTIFVHDQMPFPAVLTLEDILAAASRFYPNFDSALARRLLDYFSLPPAARVPQLSKGMKSTFHFIVGLAARCPLTLLDEPTTGMDASVRMDCYRALLKDYIRFPRTIILSSHLLNEIEDLLEEVLLLKKGTMHLHLPVSDLKEYALELTGHRRDLERFAGQLEVLHRQTMGTDRQTLIVRNALDHGLERSLHEAGIAVKAVSAARLCVYLTAESKGGIDDVFA